MAGSFAEITLDDEDRFWESLKRVGIELATPKLEPFAKGLDTLTNALNAFASNDRIQAFQRRLANGFSAAYEKARSFTVDVDWDGIEQRIGSAFSAISSAIGQAIDALSSIYSSLTGTLPGAASIGQQAGEGLKAAWDGLGQVADGVASGIKRVADALRDSIAPNAQQAQTAMEGVTESANKQATGFQTLWQALKTDALQGVKDTWESLARGAGDLLAAINSLAQKGSELLAGFIRGADFGPIRDLFNAVADAAKQLTGTLQMGRGHGQADLVLVDGVFYLLLVIETPTAPPIDPKDFIGVDLGIVQIASDSDGESFSGETVENTRRRYHELRKALQARGSRSACRHLQRIRRNEARFRRNQNHVISKKLVEKAKDTGRGIKLENLKQIRERTTVRKSDRAKHSGWSFFQLQSFIDYKAKREGVVVQYVDPRNTSRQCAACGHIDKANRKTQSRFQCVSCGHVTNADKNAAINIAARANVN